MRRNPHFIQNVHVINGENRPIDFRGGTKETVILRRWESITGEFSIIK